MICVH